MQIVTVNKSGWQFSSVTAVVLLCVLFGTVCRAGQLTLEPPTSILNKEVAAVARGWMNALLKKDFKTLAALSIPEYQVGIRSGLSNQGSKLYRALYVSKTSPYRKFKDIQDFEIAVLGHKDLQKLGQGTTACFFNRSNPPSIWPSDFALLPSVEKRGDVYCIFLIRSEGRWEVSTDFIERQ